jgi:hypothetical protein
LRESKELHITQTEIEDFKQEMVNHLSGHAINFIDQRVGDKNTIITFPFINGSLDAVVQLIVDDKIVFKLSIRNGLVVKIDEVKISDSNKDLIQKMYNLYKTVFKEKFTSLLNA